MSKIYRGICGAFLAAFMVIAFGGGLSGCGDDKGAQESSKENAKEAKDNGRESSGLMIEGTWNLASLKAGENDIKVEAQKVFVTISGDQFNGYAGCNSFFGNYEVEKDSIKSSGAGLTRMMCDEQSMVIEDNFIKLFADGLSEFSIKNGELFLKRKSDGVAVEARFVRENSQAKEQ